LMTEEIFPVCSPRLLDPARQLREPRDLLRYPLIHNMLHPDEWPLWFHAAGLEPPAVERGLRLESSELILTAAADGFGIAIGRRPLVDADLAANRLIAPFDVRLTSGVRYYLVCPEETADQPKIVAFRRWLLEESDGTRHGHADDRDH
jgi:LysR family transcriptional regulator, glycine cleavage system transcriptional activator